MRAGTMATIFMTLLLEAGYSGEIKVEDGDGSDVR